MPIVLLSGGIRWGYHGTDASTRRRILEARAAEAGIYIHLMKHRGIYEGDALKADRPMLPIVSSWWMAGRAAVQPLVLVVAEDPQRPHALRSMLAGSGIRTVRVGLALPALTRALALSPGLVVFDWNRPAVDGLGVTSRLRRATQTPILVVLTEAEKRSRAAILDAGASDCVPASLGVSEQLSRIRGWLKRIASPSAMRITSERSRGRLRLDRERRILFVDGTEMHITPMECRLVTGIGGICHQ